MPLQLNYLRAFFLSGNDSHFFLAGNDSHFFHHSFQPSAPVSSGWLTLRGASGPEDSVENYRQTRRSLVCSGCAGYPHVFLSYPDSSWAHKVTLMKVAKYERLHPFLLWPHFCVSLQPSPCFDTLWQAVCARKLRTVFMGFQHHWISSQTFITCLMTGTVLRTGVKKEYTIFCKRE